MLIDAAKHETSTAHVATTDERRREQKLLRKGRKEHIYIFACGDAAQQNRLAARAERLRKRLGVLLQGLAKLLRRRVDVGLCETREVVQRYPDRGREKTRLGVMTNIPEVSPRGGRAKASA
jgi:hypothetical protein